MRPTGIPPHIGVMIELKTVTETLRTLPDSLVENIGRIIEEREATASRPVTKDDVRVVVSETFQSFWQAYFQDRDSGSHRQQGDHVDSPDPDSEAGPKLFIVDGKMSRLPPDFKLPTGNLQAAWISYLLCDRQNNLPPLRAIYGREMSRKLGPSFSRYKQLMEAIIDQAKTQGIWIEPQNSEQAYDILDRVDLSSIVSSETLTKRFRRLNQLSWSTLAHDYYLSHRQPKRPRLEDDDDH